MKTMISLSEHGRQGDDHARMRFPLNHNLRRETAMNDQKAPINEKQQKRTAQELDRLRRGKVGDDVPDASKERHTGNRG
jgi:hypothetical protein